MVTKTQGTTYSMSGETTDTMGEEMTDEVEFLFVLFFLICKYKTMAAMFLRVANVPALLHYYHKQKIRNQIEKKKTGAGTNHGANLGKINGVL